MPWHTHRGIRWFCRLGNNRHVAVDSAGRTCCGVDLDRHKNMPAGIASRITVGHGNQCNIAADDGELVYGVSAAIGTVERNIAAHAGASKK